MTYIDPDQAEKARRSIVSRLRRLRAGRILLRSVAGAGSALAWACGFGLILLAAESALYLSPGVKTAAEVIWLAVSAATLWREGLRSAVRPETLEATARRVEARISEHHGRLITALQLSAPPGDKATHSSALAHAAVVQAAQVLHKQPVPPLEAPRQTWQRLGIGVACAALLAISFLQWPGSLQAAARRLGNPRTEFARPPEVWFSVTPGDTTVIAGEPLEIVADLTGLVPPHAMLLSRDTGVAIWSPSPLPVRQNRALHRVASVRRPFEYRLQVTGAETPTYRVLVRHRPAVARITAEYAYPAYTGLEDEKTTDAGDLVATAGTRVSLEIQASVPLGDAWLSVGDSTRIDCHVDRHTASASLLIRENNHYTVGLQDLDGLGNADPVTYRIVALDDRKPEVRVLSPTGDVEISGAMRLPVRVEASDDFGVARLTLRYRIGEDDAFTSSPVILDSANVRQLTQDFVWDLADLDLLPGDEIVYRLRAWDNNELTGPGFGESRDHILRLPSLADIHHRAQQAQQDAVNEMTALHEVSERVIERLDRAARELARGQEMAWQERRELKSAMEEQASGGQKLEDVVRRLDEALSDLEESNSMEPETLQKLDEVRRLLDQVESPELRRAMESLQTALDDVDPASVASALESFREEQEAFRKSLERSIALLSRVRSQQMLDALVAAAEALVDGQREIGRELADEDAQEHLADRQRALKKDTDAISDGMHQVAEELPAQGPAADAVDRASRQFDDRRVPDRMAQIGRDMEAGRASDAGTRSRGVQEDLERLRDRLREARKEFTDRMKAEVESDLAGLLHDLIGLSRDQEETARKSADVRRPGEGEPLALEQARILSGAGKIARRLLEAGQKTFFVTPGLGASLGRSIQKMEETAENIQSGKGNRAAASAADAMGGLNATALGVRQALSDLASAASAMGFEEMVQKMQQMAAQQAGLNAETESMLGNQPGGQRPGGIRQLAARQRALQEALSELQDQAGPSRRKLMGDLDNLAAEMERVARDLDRSPVAPQTLQRQQRILSRLLDAQRSARERGWSKSREAKSGSDVAYRGPGSLPGDLGEREDPLRQRLAQALRGDMPTEYRTLVKRYFELLMQDARTTDEAKP